MQAIKEREQEAKNNKYNSRDRKNIYRQIRTHEKDVPKQMNKVKLKLNKSKNTQKQEGKNNKAI